MRERVVVLGASGFIGQALFDRLSPRYEVLGVDLQPSPRRPVTQADLTDPDQIDELVQAWAQGPGRLAGIIDLVAHYDFHNRPQDPRYGQVEAGLSHLLMRMKQELPDDVPFLFASSMASLQPTDPGRPQTEDSPRFGAWAYPAHKLRCEQILEAADIPQPRVELVLAAVYSDWCELVPLFFQLERIRNQSLSAHVYPGAVDRGLTYVHLTEVARAFEMALVVRQPGIHRYLVGERRPATYQEIQRLATEAFTGRRKRLFRVPKPLARTGAAVLSGLKAEPFVQPWMVDFAGEHFEFDTTRIREELGFVAEGHLLERLPGMVERAKRDPEAWKSRNEARPR